MGSLGWAQCKWCWAWKYNMYILDGLSVPLCGRCTHRACEGLEPPWWPNERQRWRLLIERLFRRQLRHQPLIPTKICHRIAHFVAGRWAP
jgi:hypothetical protein